MRHTKIKKWSVYFLPLLLILLLLSGCQAFNGYREPELQYFVSAMGFDRSGDLIEASLEVVIFSVGDTEGKIETRLFSGSGCTVRESIGNLSGEVAKKLVFNHCALIVLGESLSPEQCDKIYDFCTPENGINVSASVICTPNAKALLDTPSISTPVTGYDITGVIKQKSSDWGIGLSNRIYRIGDARMRGSRCYTLPFFVIVESNDEDKMYSFFGTRVYEDDMPTAILDLSDSALFSLIDGSYKSGTFFVDNEGKTLQATVEDAKTKVYGNIEEGKLNVNVKVTLRLAEEINDTTDPDMLAEILERNCLRFAEKIRSCCGTDPFNLRSKLNFPNGNMPDGIENAEIGRFSVDFEIISPKAG